MADANAEEVSSPTTLVMRYLQSKGVSPNMKNYGAQVRAALEANAKDPTLIPGLRNDTPATEADDQAAMRAAGKGGGAGVGRGGGSSVAGQVERSNPPNVDLSRGPTNEADWQPNTDTKTSSASPTDSTQRTGPTDWSSFLTPAAIAGAAVGAGAIPGLMNDRGEYVGNAQTPSGRMTDVNPTAIASPDTKLLPGPDAALPPPPTSLEQAMQLAVSPAASGGGLAAAPEATVTAPSGPGPDLTGVRPFTPNPGGLGTQPLPAGINPNEVSSIRPGPTTTVLPENTAGAPRVPIRPVAPGPQPSMRSLTAPSFYDNLGAQIARMLPGLRGFRP